MVYFAEAFEEESGENVIDGDAIVRAFQKNALKIAHLMKVATEKEAVIEEISGRLENTLLEFQAFHAAIEESKPVLTSGPNLSISYSPGLRVLQKAMEG